jgi:hypothetical protein
MQFDDLGTSRWLLRACDPAARRGQLLVSREESGANRAEEIPRNCTGRLGLSGRPRIAPALVTAQGRGLSDVPRRVEASAPSGIGANS